MINDFMITLYVFVGLVYYAVAAYHVRGIQSFPAQLLVHAVNCIVDQVSGPAGASGGKGSAAPYLSSAALSLLLGVYCYNEPEATKMDFGNTYVCFLSCPVNLAKALLASWGDLETHLRWAPWAGIV